MRFPPRTLEGIANCRIDGAFRRWERPPVKAGGRQLTAIGVIGFDSVETVAREAVTDVEATRAGFESAAQLLGSLDRREAGDIHRVERRGGGPGPPGAPAGARR